VQARQVDKDLTEMAALTQELRQKGVRGKSLYVALSQVPILQNTLKGIPGTFLHSEQTDLLAAASLEDTIRTFDGVKQVRPELEKWLPLLREWNQLYNRAVEETKANEHLVANLRQSLSHPPAGLQTAPIVIRVDYISSQVTGLNNRLSQPEVEHLKGLQREATRLRKLAEDAGQQFSHAMQKTGELSRALSALQTSLDSLSTQISVLEKHAAFPLVWDESGSTLTGLRQRLDEIGPANRARKPEEIQAALEEIERMQARQQTLAGHHPRVAEKHAALVTLLETAELKDGPAWIRKTRDLVAQAEPYDPKNWARMDAVTTLKTDLETLSALQERLVPVDRPAQVKESNLEERLKDTQQLATLHKALRPRAEAVRTRLEKMQTLENEGKDRLTAAWSALERVAILAENNDLLREAAAADIKRLSEELKTTAKELNEQGQGTIEKKAQRIQAQAAAVAQALNGWLARLNTEINTLVHQVNDRLMELSGITVLEDPFVTEARSLLAREDVRTEHSLGERRTPTGSLGRKTALSDQEASIEIKRKNDLWVTVLGAKQALDEKSGSVLAAYREAVSARNQARERLAELSERIPQRRTWPPVNQTAVPDDQGLPSIDARWDAMKTQRTTADAATSELRRLEGQYQGLVERAHQTLDRITQDQERVTEIEDQIENLQQEWQLMAQSTPDNLLLIQGVQQLLSKTDSQIAYIRQQYMRSTLSYGDVLRSLQLLYDEIYTARVPVDDQNDTGLTTQHPRAGASGG
jgi:chromosome segregation ATPase